MADDDVEQPKQPQPAESLSEWIMKKAADAARLGGGILQAPAMDVADDRSGQLSPPHSPTHHAAGVGQPDGWVRARALAEGLPPSITEAILSNTQPHLPPQGPEPGQDLGTFGIGPDQSITESILNDPGRFQADSEPEHDRDMGREK